MAYQIYKNVDGQLMRLVYPNSGNGALTFDRLDDAIAHVDKLRYAQYVVLDKHKQIVYTAFPQQPNDPIEL